MTFARTIRVVETHPASVPNRIVASGLAPIPGVTMAERAAWLRASEEVAAPAPMLCHEPRGQSDQFGALLTPPTVPGSAIGAISSSRSGARAAAATPQSASLPCPRCCGAARANRFGDGGMR